MNVKDVLDRSKKGINEFMCGGQESVIYDCDINTLWMCIKSIIM